MSEMVNIDTKTLLTLAIKAHVLDQRMIVQLEAKIQELEAKIRELETDLAAAKGIKVAKDELGT